MDDRIYIFNFPLFSFHKREELSLSILGQYVFSATSERISSNGKNLSQMFDVAMGNQV